MSLRKVSIIVTAFDELARPYLDICMRSIDLLNYPRELLDVVLVAPDDYALEYSGVRLIKMPGRKYSNAQAMNVGFASASNDSKYFLYMNDDVILTRDCLTNLVTHAGSNPKLGLLMPISNDQQGRYALDTGLSGPYRLNEIQGDLFSAKSIYPHGLFIYDTLCTYVMLLPRKVFEQVGPLDETYQTGPDDIDYCLRVKQAGYLSAIALDALAWHAGGVTSSVTLTDEVRAQNAKAFSDKWGEPNEADLRAQDFIGE